MAETLCSLKNKNGSSGGTIDFSNYTVVDSGYSSTKTQTFSTQAGDVVCLLAGGSGTTTTTFSSVSGLTKEASNSNSVIGIASGTSVSATVPSYGFSHAILRA